MIIGVTGTFGSGKDEVAKYLESSGFQHLSTADVLRDFARERGIGVDRESVRKLADQLKLEFGGDVLARKAVEQKRKENLVVSALRRKEEIDYLKSLGHFTLIFVDAPIEIRLKRLQKRGRDIESNLTMAQLTAKEEYERSGAGSQNIDYCMQEADFKVINDGTLEDLYNKVDKIKEKL